MTTEFVLEHHPSPVIGFNRSSIDIESFEKSYICQHAVMAAGLPLDGNALLSVPRRTPSTITLNEQAPSHGERERGVRKLFWMCVSVSANERGADRRSYFSIDDGLREQEMELILCMLAQ